MELAKAVERRLGGVERLYWMMDRAGGANFVMIAELAGALSDEQVERALRALPALHPLLAVACVPSGKRDLAFAVCDEAVEFRSLVLQAGEAWLPHAEADQVRHFELESGPLWRCLLLHYPGLRSILVVTFHHSIADGNSGAAIVQDLMRILASGTTPERAPSGDYAVPPLETYLPRWSAGVWGLVRFLWDLVAVWLGWVLTGIPRQVPRDSKPGRGQRRDRFLVLEFDEQETRAVIANCRAQNHTVNSALHAAQLLSIAEELSDESSVLGILCQLDLRRWMDPPVPGAEMGLGLGIIPLSHRVRRGSPVAPLAARIQKSLQAEIARRSHLLVVPWLAKLSALLPRTDSAATGLVARNRVLSAGLTVLSNVGKIRWQLSGALQVTGLHFFVPLCGGPIFGSSALSFNGQLRWNFSYSDPDIAAVRAQRIAARAKQILLSGHAA